MELTICGSLVFVNEMNDIQIELENLGHTVTVPLGVDLVNTRGVTLEEFVKLKDEGKHHTLTIQHDAIRTHYKKIVSSDAILVTNWEKRGVENYIGGNTFLEMGFAHVNDKEIFILNGIPEMPYTDEIHAMQPMVLHGRLDSIAVTKKELSTA
jgi:hypothetical protein